MMKKMYLAFAIILVLAVAAYYLFKQEKLIVERNKEPLNTAYNQYQQVNESYHSNDFLVEKLCRVTVSGAASPNPIRIFLSVKDQLIIDADARVDDDTKADTRYYKIDKNGSVIDSLYDAYQGYWGQFIDDFMVFTSEKDDYYTTWPVNGDTTKHVIQDVNKSLTWDNDQIEDKIKDVKQNGQYYFFSAFVRDSKYYRKLYFYTEKKWQVLWQKMDEYTNVPDSESASRYRKDAFRTGEGDFELAKNVSLVYFYPEDKIKYYHIIGGGSGGFSEYNWRGKAFFKTTIAGKNFEFMQPNIVLEKEKHDGFKTRLYIVDEPGDAVKIFRAAFYFSPNGFAFYAPNPKELLLIKTKDR